MIELYEKAASAAYENAIDLIDDADILIAKRKFARAQALLVLACEEFAKMMLYKFYSVGIVKQEEFKEFENAIINHTPKIKLFKKLIAGTSVVSQNKEKVRDMVLNQKKSIREVLESLQKEMEEDEVWRIFETANQAKKAAFYVEVSSNKLSIPKNVISEELSSKNHQGT